MRRYPGVRSSSLGASVAAAASAVALCLASTVVAAPVAYADAERSAQWYLGPLGFERAWQVTRGAGVRIGIADSGVDGRAPDLRGVVVGGKDFSGSGAADGQRPVDGEFHGTSVAAFAAARGHGAAAGIIGAAPRAQIVSASVSIDDPSTTPAAVRWLADQGVGVINVSIATSSPLMRGAVEYAESKDVVVVAATGDVANGAFEPGEPATLPGVVGVTGVDRDLRRDPGATVGPGTAVAAPFSTTPTDPASESVDIGLPGVMPVGSTDGAYRQVVGTSFSAPIVAGVVALIRARYPRLDAANVINRLLRSATPAGAPGVDPTYGYGIVDAYRALTAKIAPVTANPLGSLVPANSGAAPGDPSSLPAPSSGTSSRPGGRGAPRSVTASAPSASSGPGTGGWIGIVAAVVVVAGGAAWLLGRRRRPGS